MERAQQKPSFEAALREKLEAYTSRPLSRRDVGQGRANLIETAKPITDAIVESPEDVTQTLDAAMPILFEYLGHDDGDLAVNKVLEQVVVQMMLKIGGEKGLPPVVAVGETAMLQNIVTLAEYLPKKEASKVANDETVAAIVKETRTGRSRGKRTTSVRPL